MHTPELEQVRLEQLTEIRGLCRVQCWREKINLEKRCSRRKTLQERIHAAWFNRRISGEARRLRRSYLRTRGCGRNYWVQIYKGKLLRSRPKFPSLTRETKTIIYIIITTYWYENIRETYLRSKTPPHAREQRKKRTNGKQKHKTRNN